MYSSGQGWDEMKWDEWVSERVSTPCKYTSCEQEKKYEVSLIFPSPPLFTEGNVVSRKVFHSCIHSLEFSRVERPKSSLNAFSLLTSLPSSLFAPSLSKSSSLTFETLLHKSLIPTARAKDQGQKRRRGRKWIRIRIRTRLRTTRKQF